MFIVLHIRITIGVLCIGVAIAWYSVHPCCCCCNVRHNVAAIYKGKREDGEWPILEDTKPSLYQYAAVLTPIAQLSPSSR